MKILFIEWKSFGNEDMIDAYEESGYEVIRLPFERKDMRNDVDFEKELSDSIRQHSPSYVFSFNYFPIVSKVCKKEDITYVSWIYDSPYVLLYSYTTINPCNVIFVFDKELCMEFQKAGIKTVHYLPMAANTKRLDSMTDTAAFENSIWKNEASIAFIGSMYTEKHLFYERLEGISPYTRGYLEAIIAAQRKVYGYNFIQEVLPAPIIEDMQKVLPMEPHADGVESVEYLYAQYVINRHITGLERMDFLKAITAHHALDLYTPDQSFFMPNVFNHGPVDYYDMAPYVFKKALINLNISLRSIKSGIPLRAFDILGAGGFLLSNYQSDFLDFFTPDEDFIYFDSEADMLHKIDYYLAHEDERAAIARNGHARIAAAHTYLHRIKEIETYL